MFVLTSLKNRVIYYGISILSIMLLMVHSKNLIMLNSDYSVLNFFRNPNEYGVAALSGIFLLIVTTLLILGCAMKWINIIIHAEDAGDKIDGVIRILIAIWSGFICYTYYNKIIALCLGIAFVICIFLFFIHDN
ncbi:hypothetical protein [Lacrimispora xylanolytica]|uniref:Uncharacterized protein n=1 Tax=Lacrimispora xylanolytica TaxID=29375 RepID=A0ABY7ABG7_9FIRM|nr:hypothetical protein [Lacrimispora xylanolytica]WAJ22888.1 hypothetical protein OW255_15115 [Lacrimispora xylanolytica]